MASQVGEIFQFIAEAFGRTETQDVIHRRAEPAQIVFILPCCRLAIQFRMQGSAKLLQRLLAGVDGLPGRFAQGQSLGDDIGKPQHECRHANREQQRFAIFDGVVREVAMHYRQVQRTTENQAIKGRTRQNAPDDRRPHDRSGKMVQGIHSRFLGQRERLGSLGNFSEDYRPKSAFTPNHRRNGNRCLAESATGGCLGRPR